MSSTGYHHVEQVMGTAVSIDVRDEVIGAPGLDDVLVWLRHVDETFSTYRDDSAITRLGRGALGRVDASDEVRDVLSQCEELRRETNRAFDIDAVPAPNGTSLDPSGFVKGWSIERAAHLLEEQGLTNFCINAGGDIAIRGRPESDRAWRVGVRGPDQLDRFAALLDLFGPMAVATSATYERGSHIVDPRNGLAADSLTSVTVVGPDLGLADAYATAIFVMGVEGLDWLTERAGYDGFVVTPSAQTIATPGFARLRVESVSGPQRPGLGASTPIPTRAPPLRTARWTRRRP